MKAYRGRCHCGAVQWTLTSEEITKGLRCNCSICVRKGALMSARYYSADALTDFTGRDTLKAYIFGDRMMTHWFCPTCGVSPYSDVIETPRRYRINLGCLEGLDVLSLPFDVVDGKSF